MSVATTQYIADLPNQRQYVRTLMRHQELPLRMVTVLHRKIFFAAGVPWNDGQSMDALLDSLTMPQLRKLADQLRHDDIDEEND